MNHPVPDQSFPNFPIQQGNNQAIPNNPQQMQNFQQSFGRMNSGMQGMHHFPMQAFPGMPMNPMMQQGQFPYGTPHHMNQNALQLLQMQQNSHMNPNINIPNAGNNPINPQNSQMMGVQMTQGMIPGFNPYQMPGYPGVMAQKNVQNVNNASHSTNTKKKSSKNAPKQMPPPSTPPSVSTPIDSSLGNPSPQPVRIPSTNQIMATPFLPQNNSEVATITQIIISLPEDKQDLFFKLFENGSPRKKENRIESFTSIFNPAYPNMSKTVFAILDSFRNQTEIFTKFKEPYCPKVLTQTKNNKILYNFFPSYLSSIEIGNTLTKRVDTISVCHFINLSEPTNNQPLYINNIEIPSVSFGENTPCYIIPDQVLVSPKLIFSYPMKNSISLKWLIIQQFVRRPATEVLMEITNKPQGSNCSCAKDITSFPAHTTSCKGCVFDAYKVIDEISRIGSSKCPNCSVQILLSEIQPEQTVNKEPKARIRIEDDEEMKKARQVYADNLSNIIKPKSSNIQWKKAIFEEPVMVPKDTPCSKFLINSLDEYIRELESI